LIWKKETKNDRIHFGYGDSTRHESQLAFTLGMVQAERQEATAKMMSRGIKKGHGEA